jgi:hypothetical protein
MKKVDLKTPIEKIEFIIYVIHLFLILLFLFVVIGFSGLLIFSLVHDLTNVVFQCIMSIAICGFVIYTCITNSKFKEIRKKFNNRFFEKRGNKK